MEQTSSFDVLLEVGRVTVGPSSPMTICDRERNLAFSSGAFQANRCPSQSIGLYLSPCHQRQDGTVTVAAIDEGWMSRS